MDKTGKAEDIWFKSIPPAQRLSRQQMISIADGYFTGLQKNDGKGIQGTGTYPFTNDCHRIENGSPTTNVPRPANEPPGTINLFAMDCLSQFKMGLYYVVQNIHGRRYPLVDSERGVVWAHAVFDQGTVNQGVLSDGTKHSYPGLQPAEQHPGHRGVPDRERQDPPRRDDRSRGDVSHELAVARRPERQLAGLKDLRPLHEELQADSVGVIAHVSLSPPDLQQGWNAHGEFGNDNLAAHGTGYVGVAVRQKT